MDNKDNSNPTKLLWQGMQGDIEKGTNEPGTCKLPSYTKLPILT